MTFFFFRGLENLTGILCLSIFILCTSCSTYSKRECANFDWHEQGKIQALKGNTKNQSLKYYKNICSTEHGIEPDKDNFAKGYQEGLDLFCSPDHATQFAKQEKEYRGICPKNREPAFLQAYFPAIVEKYKKRVETLELEKISLQGQVSQLQTQQFNQGDQCLVQGTF